MKEIKRQEALVKFPNFPQLRNSGDILFFPKEYKNFVLTLASKTLDELIENLTLPVYKLTKGLGENKLIFLGASKTPWLHQDNDYKPANDALLYLREKNINEKFNGALQVELKELKVFIKHLFWLTRCNASLPPFYFMDSGQNFIGSICKHGNIHVGILNEKTASKFEQIIKVSSFDYLEERCYDSFSDTSLIKGRRIIV